MTRTSGLDFGSDPAHQWDTKCELFHLAEACALPSAVLLCPVLPSCHSERFFSFVCLSAQNFRVFLHNCLSDWDEIFTIGATTRGEYFNDNYDVIGHVVWQPCWKNFGPLYLWNRTREKIETRHIASTLSWGMSVIFFFMTTWVPSLWRHNRIFMMSSVTWFGSHNFFLFFLIKQNGRRIVWPMM